MIFDMRYFNASCAYKARPFRLLTLEKLVAPMPSIPGGAWAAAIDLANCYGLVRMPEELLEAVRVATSTGTYTIIRVPFGWHQAQGVV